MYATNAIARKNATRTSSAAVESAVSRLSTTISPAIAAMISIPRRNGEIFMRSSCGHVRADGERGRDQGGAGEPAELRARVGRCVQPRRGDGGECERTGRVVEAVF